MSKYAAFILLLPFLVIMYFQPGLNEFEHKRKQVAQTVLIRNTELASVEGRFTPDMIKDIEEKLRMMGYSEDQMEIKVTTEFKNRTEYVEGYIKVPNQYENILLSLLFGDESERYHVVWASRMSEATS